MKKIKIKKPKIKKAKVKKDFLDLNLISAKDLQKILAHAHRLKKKNRKLLSGKTLAQIFEKPSTRTRVSFEVGMAELGGNTVTLQAADMQLGRGESIADTAKVLSRFVDVLMLRAYSHSTLLELAEHATVPVINGLTDHSHPCQIMADLLTFEEHKGNIKGKRIAWVGDGNNVLTSWIHASAKFDFMLSIACPEKLMPNKKILHLSNNLQICKTPADAVRNADAIVTDTWFSMGEKNGAARGKLLKGYQVNDKLMSLAKRNAIFMHCLPAHRGEEVSASVLDGEQSVVFDEAENRLHAQKAILHWCLS